MKDYAMGNLLVVSGDDAEDIREFVNSILSPSADSDDPADKEIDFNKIVPATDENDRLAKWGVRENAARTSVICEGDGNPPAVSTLIYFDTDNTVPMIVRALAERRPDLHFRYEYCDEDALCAGELVIENGHEAAEEYETRGQDAIVTFHGIWGRYDDFVLDKSTGKYVYADELNAEQEQE